MRRSVEVMNVIVWAAAVTAVILACGVSGRRVYVGGKDTWKPGVNYTLWASQETFYVGDWLEFMFDKNYYDVLEVNQTNYVSCNSEHFMANITRGGRDVYELKEARLYYFICSKGYCFNGMKVAIDVHKSPPPYTPSPEPKTDSGLLSSHSRSFHAIVPVFVLVILVFDFFMRVY